MTVKHSFLVSLLTSGMSGGSTVLDVPVSLDVEIPQGAFLVIHQSTVPKQFKVVGCACHPCESMIKFLVGSDYAIV